jgi:hypothetical protein
MLTRNAVMLGLVFFISLPVIADEISQPQDTVQASESEKVPTLVLGKAKSHRHEKDARACLDLPDMAKIRACAEKYR